MYFEQMRWGDEKSGEVTILLSPFRWEVSVGIGAVDPTCVTAGNDGRTDNVSFA